jgi:hypothetical protein
VNHPVTRLVLITPLARIALKPDDLDTFLSLLFSPFVAIASLTTLIVGFNAFVALAASAGTPSARERIDEAIVYGTARAFVAALAPALFLLASTIDVYT